MILQREIEIFSAEMYLDLLLKFNASEHIEDLNTNVVSMRNPWRFKICEWRLRGLKNYLEKGLAMDLEQLSVICRQNILRTITINEV